MSNKKIKIIIILGFVRVHSFVSFYFLYIIIRFSCCLVIQNEKETNENIFIFIFLLIFFFTSLLFI
jgi:hypothetical protein